MKRFVVVLCSVLATIALAACADGDSGGSGGGVDEKCRIDADGDGYYAKRPGCDGNKDCDDNDREINPSEIEIPDNGKDDDCVGGDKVTPSDCNRTVDKDGDSYYDVALKGTAQQPTSCKGEDCDDTDRKVNPGRPEIPNNSKDDDCNPNTPDDVPDCTDEDGDGWGIEGKNECPNRTADEKTKFDCNDNDGEVNPDSLEICDGKDNDCDDTGDGKGVDECLGADGKPAENIQCGTKRKLCLGHLKAPCSENRDCEVEAGFACHQGKCLLFADDADERCFDGADCVTGTCDVASGKCKSFCEANDCGTHSVCDDPPRIDRLCDDTKGCHDCEDSSFGDAENPAGGGCPCGLCAGFKCFNNNSLFASIVAPAEGEPSQLLQVLYTLIDCFANDGSNKAVLCKSYHTGDMGNVTVGEQQIDDFVCGDHEGLDGERFDLADDMVGCGFFNIDELEMDVAITAGTFYTTCAWWDGADVRVGHCDDYPADR